MIECQKTLKCTVYHKIIEVMSSDVLFVRTTVQKPNMMILPYFQTKETSKFSHLITWNHQMFHTFARKIRSIRLPK